jgi:hypothetical protein
MARRHLKTASRIVTMGFGIKMQKSPGDAGAFERRF